MNEAGMWKSLRKVMTKEGLGPRRVENTVEKGTPDVSFVEGWMELKYVDRWPVRGGPMKIAHFTQEQRIWIMTQARLGQNVWMMLGVGKERYLLGPQACEVLYEKGLTRDQAIRYAHGHWDGRVDGGELHDILQGIPQPKGSS